MPALAIRQQKARRKPGVSSSFTVAEFFSGIGLIRVALERAGWRVNFSNDIDPQKFAMYKSNFGDDHAICGDIHDISPDQVPKSLLFTASFPCNDLSIAGAMKGLNGASSSAFWGFVNILHSLDRRRPPLILVENVVGFLMSHGGQDFETALLALNELGYAVDAFMLNASAFVPQSRPRLFVVAKRVSLRRSLPDVAVSATRPAALASFINANPHIAWDIRRLPVPPKSKRRLIDIIEPLADNDGQWWEQSRAEYFMGQLSARHEVLAKLMMGGRDYSYATAFRRVRNGRSMAELRTDGIAGCLRTPRGGSGRQILFMAGKGKYRVRLLTSRECARLQGVPESFRIDVPLNQALFGFGDGVCVPAVEWISKHYLLPVAKEMIAPRLFERND